MLVGSVVFLGVIVEVNSKVILEEITRPVAERSRPPLVRIAMALCTEVHLLRASNVRWHGDAISIF